MNTSLRSPVQRSVWFAGGALAAAGLLWSLSALSAADTAAKPSVKVKVDAAPVAALSGGEPASYAPVVKRVAPSVVKVLVTARAKTVAAPDLPQFFNDPLFRQFFGNQFGNQLQVQQPPQEGMGSGVIVSADGYVLTNNHVVNGADVIKISLNDGRELTAKLVGADPSADLAVVKVDAKDLPAITFADSDRAEVGDRVLAVGNPFGIGQTVTSGMVSALGRATLGLDYEDFIQTDAAINPGNSGGALVDTQGRLLGINTAILSRSGGSQGIGFAIPANLARNVMEQLVATGKVSRGYLGVSVQDVTPALAETLAVKTKDGALVSEVAPGSPGAKAGLESGDVITKLNGKPVSDARHLKLSAANIAPGTSVPLEIVRDGKTKSLDLKVGERPGEKEVARLNQRGLRNNGDTGKAAPSASDDEGVLNGVGVADLDRIVRRQLNIPAAVRGALVTQVEPGSAAASAGVQPGDVIQEINRQPVADADEAVKLTEKTDTKKTLLRVWNATGTRYVVVDESAPAGRS